ISEGLANRSINDQKRIFNEITEFYLLSQHSKEKELQLNKKKVVFFKGASCRITNVFYHPDLSKVPVENYSSVQNVVFEKLQIQIPDYDYLQLYNAAPFELESKSDGLPTEEINVTLDDAKDLLHFWNCCSISILSFFNVKYNSDNSLHIYKGDGRNF